MVVSALREWKLQCPRGELGLVFPNRLGKVAPIPTSSSKAMRRSRSSRVTGGGRRTSPKYGLHALRHACASSADRGGPQSEADPGADGAFLDQVTYDTYGHLFEDADADERAAARCRRGCWAAKTTPPLHHELRKPLISFAGKHTLTLFV